MKKCGGMITYEFDPKTLKPSRLIDHITHELGRRGCFKFYDSMALENENGEIAGGIMTICGPKFLVKFLEKATDHVTGHNVEFDVNDYGKITSTKEL